MSSCNLTTGPQTGQHEPQMAQHEPQMEQREPQMGIPMHMHLGTHQYPCFFPWEALFC